MLRVVKKQAMSLMEVIVLMTAVSFLAGVFVNMMFFSSAISGMKKTGSRIDSVKTAIEHYVEQNGVLPCPASLEVDYANKQYGTSADCSAALPGGVFSSGQGDNEVAQGWVPFKTLGLRERDAYDAWGRRLRYVVVKKLTKDYRSFLIYRPTANGAISILDKKNNSVVDTSKHVVAYMLLSHGKKAVGGYNKNGKATACNYQGMQTQPKEIENCNNDSVFFYAEPSFVLDESYHDDMTRWFFLDSISGSIAKNNSNPYGRRHFIVKNILVAGDEIRLAEDGFYLLPDSKGIVDAAGWESDPGGASMQKIPAIALIKNHVVHGNAPCKRNDLILTENNLLFSVNDDGSLTYQPRSRAGVVAVFDVSAPNLGKGSVANQEGLSINTSSNALDNRELRWSYGGGYFPAYFDEKTVALAVGADGRLYKPSFSGGKAVGWQDLN